MRGVVLRAGRLSRLQRGQAQRRGLADLPSLTGLVQGGIVGLQSATQLPWWATFGAATVLVRVGIFPLVHRQILASRKLAGAVPELNFLFQLLRQRLKGIPMGQASEQLRVVSIFLKGVGACIKLHGVSPTQILASPLANMAVFITFVYSLRGLLTGDQSLDLSSAGVLWFPDLTTKDRTFALPLAAAGVSYTALELAFRSSAAVGGAARFTLLLKDTFQSLMLLSLPFVLPLPAGVFCYWIPSSLCGITQTLLLRSAAVQRLLKIQAPVPKHLSGAAAGAVPSAASTAAAAVAKKA